MSADVEPLTHRALIAPAFLPGEEQPQEEGAEPKERSNEPVPPGEREQEAG